MIDHPARPIPGHDPRAAGDRVLADLLRVTPPDIKGAHDSDLAIIDGKAYIVCQANRSRLGESPDWHDVTCELIIVDIATGAIEQHTTIAASERVYANDRLPPGACFVPRLVAKDDGTLRCFFASEDFGVRESQTWHLDLDRDGTVIGDRIHRTLLRTMHGVAPMQPLHFHRHGEARGFTRPVCPSGLFLVDGFKRSDGRIVAQLNNFNSGQLAVAELNAAMDCLTIISDLPSDGLRLSEAAIGSLPDASWLAIVRHDGGDGNYRCARSPDGRRWNSAVPWGLIPDGIPSKPTLDRHGDVWCLGWNAREQVDGVSRSVFHLDLSRDGRQWYRGLTFATRESFQYPMFRCWQDQVYLTVTQGRASDDHHSGKESIRFGRLGSVADLRAWCPC